jgi:hypothetical protein
MVEGVSIEESLAVCPELVADICEICFSLSWKQTMLPSVLYPLCQSHITMSYTAWSEDFSALYLRRRSYQTVCLRVTFSDVCRSTDLPACLLWCASVLM